MKVNERRKENGKHTLIKVVKNHDKVCMDICRFIYVNALYFISKKRKEKKRKGHLFLKWLIPLLNMKRNWNYLLIMTLTSYLKKEVKNVNETLNKYKVKWKKIGCTLMFDGWSDGWG